MNRMQITVWKTVCYYSRVEIGMDNILCDMHDLFSGRAKI